MHSLRALAVATAGVVGVDVHGLGQRALDDAAGAAHEPLELRRQQDRLLLICAQLPHYINPHAIVKSYTPVRNMAAQD